MRNNFIFLSAFSMIVRAMTATESFEKIPILKIWQLVFFWGIKTYLMWKYILNWLENKNWNINCNIVQDFRVFLMYKLICQKPGHVLSAQMTGLSCFFQVFRVLGMHNFAVLLNWSTIEKGASFSLHWFQKPLELSFRSAGSEWVHAHREISRFSIHN